MVAVINSGSSSIKCSLFEKEKCIEHFVYEEIKSHHETLQELLKQIKIDRLECVVHRVVHGGDYFVKPTVMDRENLEELKKFIPLAPLHNPANIEAIGYFLDYYPAIAQIAVFDTAFHDTMPEYAKKYAIDQEVSNKHHIKKYGFHGSSHAYLTKEAASLLKKERPSLITLHLGNGASICAVHEGKSIDTSMGFTPLEGLVMGTRSGDIDPGVIFYLMQTTGMDATEIEILLNKRSGLYGVCGKSDLREILKCDDPSCHLAIEMMVYRIKKYIGAYMAILPQIDAIVFSGGIGEHSSEIRQKVLSGMEKFGILTDFEANEAGKCIISKKQSTVKVYVIQTDEELEMVRSARKVL